MSARPTVLDAAWCNRLQAEIAQAIESGAPAILDGAAAQLYAAIEPMVRATVIATVTEIFERAAAGRSAVIASGAYPWGDGGMPSPREPEMADRETE